MPTGKILNIKNTNFDFTDFKNISEAIKANEKNFDNCYYFDNDGKVITVAEVLDQVSGRGMKVSSNQVGMQLYTPFYERPFWGQYGVPAFGNGALCLETQALPDSPNQPNFPSTLLLPNQLYESITNLGSSFTARARARTTRAFCPPRSSLRPICTPWASTSSRVRAT